MKFDEQLISIINFPPKFRSVYIQFMNESVELRMNQINII